MEESQKEDRQLPDHSWPKKVKPQICGGFLYYQKLRNTCLRTSHRGWVTEVEWRTRSLEERKSRHWEVRVWGRQPTWRDFPMVMILNDSVTQGVWRWLQAGGVEVHSTEFQSWEDWVVGQEHRREEEQLRHSGEDQERHLPHLWADSTRAVAEKRATMWGLQEKQQHNPQGEPGFH